MGRKEGGGEEGGRKEGGGEEGGRKEGGGHGGRRSAKKRCLIYTRAIEREGGRELSRY